MTTTNTEVQARSTLKTTLVAGDIKALAVFIAKLGGDKDGVAKLGLTFSLAVKEAKEVLKTQEQQAKIDAENAAARRAEKAAAKQSTKQAEIAALNKERNEEKERMLKFLTDKVDGLGLDLEAAEAAAQSAIDKKYGKVTKKYTFNRVPVVVDGKEYDMPTSGNMVQALKDAMARGGYTTHKGFILDHAKDKEAAKAMFSDAE